MEHKTANILSVGFDSDLNSLADLEIRHLKVTAGLEASKLLRVFDPDVVLIRWELTDMPGEVLLKKILATKPAASTIAVVEAGNTDQEVAARTAGATAVVDEAIDSRLLCEMTTQLCQCRKIAAG